MCIIELDFKISFWYEEIGFRKLILTHFVHISTVTYKKALQKISARSSSMHVVYMLQVTCLRSVNIEINMNMNSGQGYGHAYFLCKDRQILRLSVCFYGPDKTTISSVHSARITLPRRSQFPKIRLPVVHGCMPSSSHAARASASEICCCTKLIWMQQGTHAYQQLIFFPHGCTSTNSTMLTWWQYDTEVRSRYSTISFSSTAAVSGAMEQWDVKSIFALAGEISMVNFRSCVIRNQIILHARVKSACLLTKSRKDNHA